MTATEWLWEQIDGIIPYQDINTSQLFIGLLEQAKEMEKQQIIDAHIDGYESISGQAEQYYNETYGSKGSDETKGGELATFNTSSQTEISDEERKILVHKKHCFQGEYEDTCKYGDDETCPARKNYTQEISDEEIMEAAYKYAEVYQCPTEIKMCKHDVISAWNKSIKWYREQLKKKQ